MRIDYLLFGYRTVSVKECDRCRMLTALINSGISFDTDCDFRIIIPEYRVKKFATVAKGVEYTMSAPLGLLSNLWRVKKSVGALLGILLSAVLLIISSDFVFDIRIEQSDGIGRESVALALAEADFSVGDRWSKTDLDKIEGLVMLNDSNIGFISINRRGTCAYVSASSKSEGGEQTQPYGKCNVVAKYDCVIEEITVKSGIATVKSGDTVKAGDLLISGVIPQELGGGTLSAEGSVKGRITEKISAEVLKNERVREYADERLCEIKINILGFSINIFKNYGNLSDKYDIIKSEEVLLAPDGVKLPISVMKIYAEPYVEAEADYNDTELVALATHRHREKLDKILAECEILKISTESSISDSGCTVVSDMLLLTEVGEKRSIE